MQQPLFESVWQCVLHAYKVVLGRISYQSVTQLFISYTFLLCALCMCGMSYHKNESEQSVFGRPKFQ